MMLRPASQLQGAHGSFSMDSSMHSSVGPAMSYGQHHSLPPHMAAESFAASASPSFTDHDSQMLEREDDEGDSFASLPANAKPSSRTSANNELEMRQLYQSNRHRKLDEIAEELHGNERGPNSERARQIFAMLW